MKRINYHVTERQIERLKALSERTGLSVADLIRRAIDAYLEREEKKRGDR
jgi:predicted DNA-binding protein